MDGACLANSPLPIHAALVPRRVEPTIDVAVGTFLLVVSTNAVLVSAFYVGFTLAPR